MPAATRILSLNLGSHTVGLAEFQTQSNGGLVLNAYRLREILADRENRYVMYVGRRTAIHIAKTTISEYFS
jgi:hypothetical protein